MFVVHRERLSKRVNGEAKVVYDAVVAEKDEIMRQKQTLLERGS